MWPLFLFLKDIFKTDFPGEDWKKNGAPKENAEKLLNL